MTIQESEHQIITAYEVHARRPADVTLWTAALDRHQAIFGRAPDLAAGDRGFSSATNEQAATDRGVRRVVLPRRGPEVSGAARVRTPTLVPSRTTLARRLRRPHQCAQTATWTPTAVATMATTACTAGSGFGVIADNLMNIATFAKARAAA